MRHNTTLLIDEDGFAWKRKGISSEVRSELCTGLMGKMETATESGSRRGESVYALRNVLDIPAVRSLTHSSGLRDLVKPIFGPEAFPVRGIFFDKTPDANWIVPWHQDLSIAVQERRDMPGWGPWSVKAGVPHVQPPVSVLERMVTTRIHLDDCGRENGPLLILPRTQKRGRLDAVQISACLSKQEPVYCLAGAGDILLMRPLLLHASGRATTPAHRRILHIEWAAEPLPDGLKWFDTLNA